MKCVDKEDKERKEKEEKRKERRKKEKDRPFSVINSGSAPSTGDGIPSLTSLVEATKGLTLMAGGLEDDIFAGIDDGESALAGGADEGWDADFQDAGQCSYTAHLYNNYNAHHYPTPLFKCRF